MHLAKKREMMLGDASEGEGGRHLPRRRACSEGGGLEFATHVTQPKSKIKRLLQRKNPKWNTTEADED